MPAPLAPTSMSVTRTTTYTPTPTGDMRTGERVSVRRDYAPTPDSAADAMTWGIFPGARPGTLATLTLTVTCDEAGQGGRVADVAYAVPLSVDGTPRSDGLPLRVVGALRRAPAPLRRAVLDDLDAALDALGLPAATMRD